ncbi:MAG: CBS domain-containing protein [Thaumarchaeota archaeon]|nr:CBS domain-containing protein [Nitrososphaerota archaeon]
MAIWECYRCSHKVEMENPPDECPNCHYSVSFWISHVEEKPPTLGDFVRRDLLKLDGNESVWDAAKMMKEHDTENVIVTINGEPTGMVTERDILYKVAAEDLPASKVLLRKVMSTPLITVPSDTPVTDGLKIMAERHIRRLIITEGGKPIGIVSHRSILGGSFRATHASDQTQPGRT